MCDNDPDEQTGNKALQKKSVIFKIQQLQFQGLLCVVKCRTAAGNPNEFSWAYPTCSFFSKFVSVLDKMSTVYPKFQVALHAFYAVAPITANVHLIVTLQTLSQFLPVQ
jgi:hypothetical protein